ncbi:MAG: hypothetical protein PHQ28_00760 [Mycobacterium sp.]|nr:hypothetical protein [Mycobacterium sp.]
MSESYGEMTARTEREERERNARWQADDALPDECGDDRNWDWRFN